MGNLVPRAFPPALSSAEKSPGNEVGVWVEFQLISTWIEGFLRAFHISPSKSRSNNAVSSAPWINNIIIIIYIQKNREGPVKNQLHLSCFSSLLFSRRISSISSSGLASRTRASSAGKTQGKSWFTFPTGEQGLLLVQQFGSCKKEFIL